MINATNLRIGNLVNGSIIQPKDLQKVIEVDSIGFGGINLWSGETCCEHDYQFSELSGIPLTEEWLLRFGLEPYGGWFYRNEKLIVEACLSKPEWSVRIRTSEESSIYLRNIKHVHELQNLTYALTNTELNLN